MITYCKKLYTVILLFSIGFGTEGICQSTISESIDPEAKTILDGISSKMDSYESMKVDFTMEMMVPGQEYDIQDGYLLQQGDMFVFDIKTQSITTNKDAVYVYLKENNEIQINDPDFGEDGSLLSPAQMMRLYETEQFFYAITEVENSITKIEFKPEDEYSDYAKLRVAINTKTDQISKIEIFSKDGSKIILTIKEIQINLEVGHADFQFNVEDYPGAYIEDLRID